MRHAKNLVLRNFESLVVLVLVAATAFAVLVAPDKIAFLNFFYLPVLIAAYHLGARQGVMVAVTAVLMVAIYAILDPAVFAPGPGHSVGLALFMWGAFLIVTAYIVGVLYDARAQTLNELKGAYESILDLLATLIDAVDKHAEDHSVRVADRAARIAVVLNLQNDEIENIHVAGLLHDVGKVDVSLETLRKAAELEAADTRGTAMLRARRALSSTGGLLRNVVPVIEMFEVPFDGSGDSGVAGQAIPLGARILAVANEYETLVAPAPYGRGLESEAAAGELQAMAGTRFDPEIVGVLFDVLGLELPRG